MAFVTFTPAARRLARATGSRTGTRNGTCGRRQVIPAAIRQDVVGRCPALALPASAPARDQAR